MRHRSLLLCSLLTSLLAHLACTQPLLESPDDQDQTQAASTRALDDAERRLTEEGGEDSDDAMSAALSAQGFSQPTIDLLVSEGLRALLLRTAHASPRSGTDALCQHTLDAWARLAARPPAGRLDALEDLTGRPLHQSPVRVTARDLADATAHPEAALDAREQRQIADAREAVANAISMHLDLPLADARARLTPIEASALTQARAAVAPFANTLATGADDPGRAAAHALHQAWDALTDTDFPDEAWPQLAELLGAPAPATPLPAPPKLALLDGAGLTCAAFPSGLSCTGKSKALPLRIALDDRELSIPLAAHTTAADALLALRARLPQTVAGCTLPSTAPSLELERTAPPLDDTLLESLTIGFEGSRVRLRGRFRASGSRLAVFTGFLGCQIRIELIAQADPSAARDFEALIELSSRLPQRAYIVEAVDPTGRLLAAASRP
ncbi:MAG: hypothetical protein JST92_23015 [Deltaproteobacteria bacterium]|nr:hypothetical protein [Deltaproteobacteria bacterium]